MNFEWMGQALCAQTDPDLFFPENGVSAHAKRTCLRCPVRTDCSAHADRLETGTTRRDRHGMWAAASPGARATRTDGPQRQLDAAARRERIIRLDQDRHSVADIAALVGLNERTIFRILAKQRGQHWEAA